MSSNTDIDSNSGISSTTDEKNDKTNPIQPTSSEDVTPIGPQPNPSGTQTDPMYGPQPSPNLMNMQMNPYAYPMYYAPSGQPGEYAYQGYPVSPTYPPQTGATTASASTSTSGTASGSISTSSASSGGALAQSNYYQPPQFISPTAGGPNGGGVASPYDASNQQYAQYYAYPYGGSGAQYYAPPTPQPLPDGTYPPPPQGHYYAYPQTYVAPNGMVTNQYAPFYPSSPSNGGGVGAGAGAGGAPGAYGASSAKGGKGGKGNKNQKNQKVSSNVSSSSSALSPTPLTSSTMSSTTYTPSTSSSTSTSTGTGRTSFAHVSSRSNYEPPSWAQTPAQAENVPRSQRNPNNERKDTTASSSGAEEDIPKWKLILRIGFRLQDLYSENLKIVWLILLTILWFDLAGSEASERISLIPQSSIEMCFPSPLIASWKGSVCIQPPHSQSKTLRHIECNRYLETSKYESDTPGNAQAAYGGLRCTATSFTNKNTPSPLPILRPENFIIHSKWSNFLLKMEYRSASSYLYINKLEEAIHFIHTDMVLLWQIIVCFVMSIEGIRITFYAIFKPICTIGQNDDPYQYNLASQHQQDDANSENKCLGCIDCGEPVMDVFRYSPFIFIYFMFRPVKLVQFLVAKRDEEKPIENYCLRLLHYSVALLHGAAVLFTAIYVQTSAYMIIPPILSITKSLFKIGRDCCNRMREDMSSFQY